MTLFTKECPSEVLIQGSRVEAAKQAVPAAAE